MLLVITSIIIFTLYFNYSINKAEAADILLEDISSSFRWSPSYTYNTFKAEVYSNAFDPYILITIDINDYRLWRYSSCNGKNLRVITNAGDINFTNTTWNASTGIFTCRIPLGGKMGKYITGYDGTELDLMPRIEYVLDDDGLSVSYQRFCRLDSKPDIYIKPSWFNTVPTVTLTTTDNQILSETLGENILSITGTVRDQNIADILNIKYTIEGLPAYTNTLISTLSADGNEQFFSCNVTIDNIIPEGTYTLKVWAEDNMGGVSSQALRTFIVDKRIKDPALRVVTFEGGDFNVQPNTGSYTEIMNGVINNNIGSGKPFYSREYKYILSGSETSLYDYGTSATYIGNNILRVVTSEGKAFDVEKDTGNYTDVSGTFLSNNFGSGKPFYNRTYEHSLYGWGPFTFHDFGFTMAYIGNNKIRVVTAQGRAFDVDKDTGAYTDITGTFIVNNFGPGKPFYLREYTHIIGGQAKTFYDWGSSMAYIGNNTLRVVTSEGKAFDVDVNTGAYTDITSTFLVNNFGEGKPFYHRTYPVTINGTTYTFHDWGTTMAYTDTQSPDISISTPMETTAFNEIVLTGKAWDKDNRNLNISASINCVAKSVNVTNTQTPQEWTLSWNIATDNIPDGNYSNITIQADAGDGNISTATYNGTISVFGAGSNVTRKKVVYEYDENGKLISRYIVTY